MINLKSIIFLCDVCDNFLKKQAATSTSERTAMSYPIIAELSFAAVGN